MVTYKIRNTHPIKNKIDFNKKKNQVVDFIPLSMLEIKIPISKFQKNIPIYRFYTVGEAYTNMELLLNCESIFNMDKHSQSKVDSRTSFCSTDTIKYSSVSFQLSNLKKYNLEI